MWNVKISQADLERWIRNNAVSFQKSADKINSTLELNGLDFSIDCLYKPSLSEINVTTTPSNPNSFNK